MNAVLDNFDLVLRAFGYTIFLFLVSAVLSLCSAPCWPPCGSGRSRAPQGRRGLRHPRAQHPAA